MKETIEARYEHITRRLNEIDSDKQGFLFSLAIKALLDDLMAERRKLVDFDTLFSKEVMEKAKWYAILVLGGDYPTNVVGSGRTVQEACHSCGMKFLFSLRGKQEVEVVALPYTFGNKESDFLARVRACIGLTAQKVED